MAVAIRGDAVTLPILKIMQGDNWSSMVLGEEMITDQGVYRLVEFGGLEVNQPGEVAVMFRWQRLGDFAVMGRLTKEPKDMMNMTADCAICMTRASQSSGVPFVELAKTAEAARTAWSRCNDAQWIESRSFSVEDIARWSGTVSAADAGFTIGTKGKALR